MATSGSGTTYVVANYLAAGNMEGDFPANVLPAGSAVEAPAATTQQSITNDPSSDISSQDDA